MPDTRAERELLLGILALQNSFVSQDQLLTAFREWTADKSVPLAEILKTHGSLAASVRPALESLVDAHIRNHDDSAEQSLAAVSGLPEGLSERLGELEDPQLERSLSGLKAPEETQSDSLIALTLTMGHATSECGRFRILRPHRRGGLGEVFVARDHELDREVALKQILPKRSEDEQEKFRFVREAEITGKLEHPGIVPVYGLGEDDGGRPYYAMRFIRGRTLREAIKQFHKADEAGDRDPAERNKEFRRLLGWFIDVCHAISYAHSRGVLHRDLKPSNVMLGRYGETLVVDWGLARVAGVDDQFGSRTDEAPVLANLSGSSSETLDGTAVGTPAYMSPEQAEGRLDMLSPATDVYGLGATLFALVTGHAPFSGKPADVIPKVARGEVPAAREVNPRAPAALESVCQRAMSRRPEDRYPTPDELAADVEAFLADEPVDAHTEPVSARARRWARRHHTLVTTAAVAVLIAAAGTAMAAGLLSRKNQQLEVANESVHEKNSQLEESNRVADEARRRASSVKDYLVKAFRRVDPAIDGRRLTVAEVLDQSLADMAEQLDEDDPSRGDLLSAIGSSYRGLGMYREMLEVFRQESQWRERIEGPETAAALKARSNVALGEYYAGHYTEAADAFRSVIARQTALLGSEHNDVLVSQNGLAMCLGGEGNHAAALKLYREILATRVRVSGEDALPTLMAVNNVATSCQSNGQLKEALELFEQNYQKHKELFGDDHLQTLLAMSRLASIEFATGNSDEAIQLYESALEKRREKLGDEHPATVESIVGLAMVYRDSSKQQRAAELLEEAWRTRERSHGEDHPLTLASLNDLARISLSLGDYEKAASLSEQCAGKCERVLGETNPKTLAALNTQAMVYFRQGKPELAVPVFERLLERHIEVYTDDHPSTNTMRNNLAMTYRNTGRLRESLPLFEKTLEWRISELGDDHPRTLISMQNMASILNQLGRLSESLALVEPTLQKHRDKLGGSHRYTLSVMDIATRVYLRLGMFRKAQPLAAECLENAREALGETHPDVLKAMDLVGTVQMRVGDVQQARESLQETVRVRTEVLGGEHPMTLSSIMRLAECCLLAGDIEKAHDLAETAHRLALTRPGKGHPLTLRAASVLGRTKSEQDGEAAVAAALLESVAVEQTKLLGSDHPSTLATRFALGIAQLKARRLEDAQRTLESVLADQTTQLDPLHPDVWRTRLMLAECLVAKPDYAGGEAVLKRTADGIARLLADRLPIESQLERETARVFVMLFEATGDTVRATEWRKRAGL